LTKTLFIKLLLQKFKKQFVTTLIPIYGNNETQQLFYLLSENYLGFSKIDISLHFNYELTVEEKNLFDEALKRLLNQEPIQYIIGTTYFYGNTFKVTPNTLIPRPETEELVEWIILDHASTRNKILDIGTGSGCIAISLAKHLSKSTISAIDFSKEALHIAQINANSNKVIIDFIHQDILIQKQFITDYDIIVSNPPYVRELEKKEMAANVLEFEPNSALFVPDTDPLVFYRKIAQLIMDSYAHSKKQRWLYFEINEYLPQETANMLTTLGFHSIEIKNDFRGKPRMIKALFN